MNYLSIAVMVTVLVATPAVAANQTWTGTISDSTCGAMHKKMPGANAAKMSDRECTLASVKNGAKYVFVHDGKVHQIENQDFASLQEHAGHTVMMTGEMTGDSVKVSKVEMPAEKGDTVKP